jgi:hypothetical protein
MGSLGFLSKSTELQSWLSFPLSNSRILCRNLHLQLCLQTQRLCGTNWSCPGGSMGSGIRCDRDLSVNPSSVFCFGRHLSTKHQSSSTGRQVMYETLGGHWNPCLGFQLWSRWGWAMGSEELIGPFCLNNEARLSHFQPGVLNLVFKRIQDSRFLCELSQLLNTGWLITKNESIRGWIKTACGLCPSLLVAGWFLVAGWGTLTYRELS